jgi:hypothetical protein
MAQRLTAQDFDQELLILFDAYVHGNLDRRGFLNQAQKYAKLAWERTLAFFRMHLGANNARS